MSAVRWIASYEVALQEARQNGRPLFLDFWEPG